MPVPLDDVYEELVCIVVSEAGAQVDVPIESEEFIVKILSDFIGSNEECLKMIRKKIRRWFMVIYFRPRWILEAEWQFTNGKPMVFIGQVDIPARNSFFHDDASCYVFWDPKTEETKTVIEVA